jgi:hypothetical protein
VDTLFDIKVLEKEGRYGPGRSDKFTNAGRGGGKEQVTRARFGMEGASRLGADFRSIQSSLVLTHIP